MPKEPPVSMIWALLTLASGFSAAGAVASQPQSECAVDGAHALLQAHTAYKQAGASTVGAHEDARPQPGVRLQTSGVGDIPVLTVETRLESETASIGFGGASAKNLGASQEWKGVSTKNKLLLEALQAMSDKDQIVVLIDGGDVVYTGCGADMLRKRYQQALACSNGASVVVSAELGAFPRDERYKEDTYVERRKCALEASGMDLQWEKAVAACDGRTFALCSSPPEYKFLNYGWLMGPVKHLIDLVSFVYGSETVSNDSSGSSEHHYYDGFDQRRAAHYMLANNGLVTLDYTGTLALSLADLHDVDEVLEAFSLDGKTAMRNRVSKTPQCFVHGNGNGKAKVEAVRKAIASTPLPLS